MLYTYSTEELIGLQDLIIGKIESNEKEIHIYGKLTRKAHCCPNCSAKTDKIHDYREQIIKDIPVYGKAAYIHLQKRRYRCQCGKRFYEKNIFLPRYHRRTNRLSAYIIDRLRNIVTFTDVGKEVNLSTTTIMRTFDLVSYGLRDLPAVISIDEFKGNTNKEKYQCIITDPVNKVVLDILPKRYESYLTTYFLRFKKSERDKVTSFVSDMWKPYASLASKLFKKADQIVDKYHWIRQVFWAFDGVRKEVQKKLSKQYRIYFKHSRKLLFKRFNDLTDEQKQQVNIMLYTSPSLSTAHFYKEEFLKILDCTDRDSAKAALSDWINSAYDGKRKTENGYEVVKSYYICESCEGCPHREKCYKGKYENRKITFSKTMARQKTKATERITADEGNILRQNRSIQVEGAFGVLKQDRDFRRFLTRGKTKNETQFFLLAFAFNINKLHNRTIYKRLGIELFNQEAA